MKENNRHPLNLQFFAEPGVTEPPAGVTPLAAPPAGQGAEIDYEKLTTILQGKQSATEDSVLKGFFKQQGLSKEQMDQAISTFKQQQAAQQPDVLALQTQATKAQELAQQKEVENKAILEAIQLGIDAKTVPYVLKLADLSSVMGADGQISEEVLKTALNKVLEDVPALKPSTEQSSGFRQVGAGSNGQQTNSDDALKAAFGIK